MANEIRFACELAVTRDGQTAGQSVNGTATQATQGVLQRSQTVNTTNTTLTLTGLTASRYIQVENTGDTNVCHVGPESGGAIIPLATLGPGEAMQFPRHTSATVRVQANANTATIQITALET